MIYVTSDLHFGHNKEFLYVKRGFRNIEEHDKALIDNWNNLVEDTDIVYVLGDIMLSDKDNGIKCWNRLKGQKRIIIGNHDTDSKIALLSQCPDTEITGYALRIKYSGISLFLSHYPTLTGNMFADGSMDKTLYNICGHVHTPDKFADADKGPIIHVEPECRDLKPVPLDDILEEIRELAQ